MDFLSIEDTLLHLDIKPGMTACEFGCGSAHFTLTLAKKLRGGRVYALDIQEEKLSALKNVSTSKKHHNVVTMLSDLEAPGGSGLKSNSLDIVVIPNLLFQSEKKYAIIKPKIFEAPKRVILIFFFGQHRSITASFFVFYGL